VDVHAERSIVSESDAATEPVGSADETPVDGVEEVEAVTVEGDAPQEGAEADPAEGEGDSGRPDPSRGDSGNALRRLEEEGEIAADYLEELIDVENGRASVAIVAEGSAERDLRRLSGSKGEVLESLQELSRLAVQARTGDRSRLMLDVAGFRAARRRTLAEVGARACQEVQRSGQSVTLEPMSAFERKVVHDVVAEAGLVSESEGEEPRRRVVVFPSAREE
jgi:spoIIIJ-associated protein